MNNADIYYPGWTTVKKIGSGGFGAVYEIQRELLGDAEKAALKVITIPAEPEEIDELYGEGYDMQSLTSRYIGQRDDILREYQLMRKLNGHTHVVNCDDVQVMPHEDGIGWDIKIKMELLTPMTKLAPEHFTEKQITKLGSDMCDALILCQKNSIIHRDIKPQNIFISDDGEYKLGDFGIARTMEHTASGTKIGTYKFMAPEVYNNQPYNATVDIYSLGLVLYWLLNGRRMPFLRPGVINPTEEDEARRRRFSGDAIPAPAYGGQELQRIVLKACEFDVGRRWQTAEEMKQALDALLSGAARSTAAEKPQAESAHTGNEANTPQENTDNVEAKLTYRYGGVSFAKAPGQLTRAQDTETHTASATRAEWGSDSTSSRTYYSESRAEAKTEATRATTIADAPKPAPKAEAPKAESVFGGKAKSADVGAKKKKNSIWLSLAVVAVCALLGSTAGKLMVNDYQGSGTAAKTQTSTAQTSTTQTSAKPSKYKPAAVELPDGLSAEDEKMYKAWAEADSRIFDSPTALSSEQIDLFVLDSFEEFSAQFAELGDEFVFNKNFNTDDDPDFQNTWERTPEWRKTYNSEYDYTEYRIRIGICDVGTKPDSSSVIGVAFAAYKQYSDGRTQIQVNPTYTGEHTDEIDSALRKIVPACCLELDGKTKSEVYKIMGINDEMVEWLATHKDNDSNSINYKDYTCYITMFDDNSSYFSLYFGNDLIGDSEDGGNSLTLSIYFYPDGTCGSYLYTHRWQQ